MANPVDAVISGVGLETQGLLTLGFNPTGLSLNTFGFLTPCDSIWGPSLEAASTSWASADASVSTAWTSADASVTTVWNDVPSVITSTEICID